MVHGSMGLRGSHLPLACLVLSTLGFILFGDVPVASAQEPADADWRQGVSRWTGSGYGGSSVLSASAIGSSADASPARLAPTWVLPQAVSSNEISAPDDGISDAPYTIPVDPTGPSAPANPLVMPNELPPDGFVRLAVQEPVDRLRVEPERIPVPRDLQDVEAKQMEAKQIEAEQELDADRFDGEFVEPVAESLPDEAIADEPPLESEVVRWYQYPQRWMRGWDSHAELGLDGSTGNARTLSIQTGWESKRKTELYTLGLDFDYRQASNRSVTTEDNGRLNLDYDRLLMDTPWSGFAKYGMEWDKFKAFDLRLFTSAGIGYHWVRRDDATLVTRFGAGGSKEIGAPDDSWIPEAVFGGEAERQLTPRQKLKGKVDYFPAWENFNNFRLVSDVAWEILLDGSENLSLRLAATDRYDSTPQGAKKNDLYYSLLLLYKF